MTNIEVQDITRLTVAPGEALLVRIPSGDASSALIQQIIDAFADALPGVKVVISSAGLAVEVIADETDDGIRFRGGGGS